MELAKNRLILGQFYSTLLYFPSILTDHKAFHNSVGKLMGICTRFSNLRDAKIEKNICQRDSIYVVWKFAYVHGVVGISLFLGKNTECSSIIFLSLKQHQNPNLQNNSFYILRIGFRMGYKNKPKRLGSISPSLRSID